MMGNPLRLAIMGAAMLAVMAAIMMMVR